MTDLDDLRSYLAGIEPGPLTEQQARDVETRLARGWEDLSVSRAGGMKTDKLLGRTELMNWDPPLLTFLIERHGGVVLGGANAELQSWAVDVARQTTAVSGGRRRQLRPTASPLKVGPLAAAIASAIIEDRIDPRIMRRGATRVRILTVERAARGG